MMKRRGLIGALGAGFGLLAKGMPVPARAQGIHLGGLVGGGGVGGEAILSDANEGERKARKKKWDLWRSLTKAESRRIRRQMEVADLLGGLPPHIHACQSWAPWFKAQKAITWRRQLSASRDTLQNRIGRQIFGEDYEQYEDD